MLKRVERFLAVLASVLLVFLDIPVHAEEENAITIDSAEDLIEFARNCSYDAYSRGLRVELSSDISLENTEFAPVPVFAGTFEGNGHTISGWVMKESYNPAGLFAEVSEGAVVENLTVSLTMAPEGERQNVGGVAGINYGTIQNCRMIGSVSGEKYAGGIAGVNAVSGIVHDCTTDGAVYGLDGTGGIVGYNLGVIDSCENNGYVNTESTDPSFSLDDLSMEPALDVHDLISTSTGVTITDAGGIAGYSCGSITLSTNHGLVGYPQIGYNIGGIAGRSSGHIGSCSNDGEIKGRRDIGGIAGQAEPYVIITFSASDAEVLSGQISQMQGLVNNMKGIADSADAELNSRLNQLSDYLNTAGSNVDALKNNISEKASEIENITPEQVESDAQKAVDDAGQAAEDEYNKTKDWTAEDYRNAAQSALDQIDASADAAAQILRSQASSDLTAAVSGISSESSLLINQVKNKGTELVNSANAVADQADAIGSTLNSLIETVSHPQDLVQDTSALDADAVLLGKIADSRNTGSISGDLNVGGIAGSMALEYQADPEDDISAQLDASTKKEYQLKCILQKDVNTGSVNAGRSECGGIAGRMDLGYLLQCENTGTVSSASGNDVGGIAGITASTVRNSYARCELSGSRNVGGIAGTGVAESTNGSQSIVADNVSMVEITRCDENPGAISGKDAGDFSGNVFVSDDLGGINRVSRTGKADPVSYQDLLAREDLPDSFRTFTLKFVADGETLKEVQFSYGDSFDESIFPDVPEKQGYYAVFDRTDLKNLHFDTTVTAEYHRILSSLASNENHENGRPVFYVEGSFDDKDILSVQRAEMTPEDFSLARDHAGAAFWDYLSHPGEGIAESEVEQWKLKLPEDGSDTHYVRYYLPAMLSQVSYQIYVREDGGTWRRADAETVGSYARFAVNGSDVEVASIFAVPGAWLYGVLAAFVMFIVMLVTRRRRRERRARVHKAFHQLLAEDRRLKIAFTAVIAAFAGFIVYGIVLLYRGSSAGLKAYQLLNDFARKDPSAVELTLDTTLGSDQESNVIEIERSRNEEADASISTITMNNLSLYYADDNVYLENGRAYHIGSETPDYARLLEQSAVILEHADITSSKSGSKTVYTLTAKQQNARKLLEILLAREEDDLPDIMSVDMTVTAEDDVLKQVTFSSTGVLKDEGKTGYTVDATVDVKDTETAAVIPEAVVSAVKDKKAPEGEITSDYLDLLYAWGSLYSKDPMAASIRLSAGGNVLNVSENLQYHRVLNEGNPITCLQMNDLVIYYGNGKVCTEDGSLSLNAGQKKLADNGKYLEFAYGICMDGKFDLSDAAGTKLFTISMDEDGMQELADMITNGNSADALQLKSGTLQVTVSNGGIKRILCSINGTAGIEDVQVPVSASAETTINDQSDFKVPDAVIKALQ